MGIRTVPASGNSKTGIMAVTYRMVGSEGSGTCSDKCPFLGNGCYAQSGNVNIWQKRSEYSESDGLLLYRFVQSLPTGYMLRHHVSGDVLFNNAVDWDYIQWMNKAALSRPDISQFTYTHAWKEIGSNPFKGVVMNASCETIEQVKEAKELGYPVVMVVDSEDKRVSWREQGLRFRTCPQQLQSITCGTCKLCAKEDREQVVVFRAHGKSYKRVNAVL